MFPMVCGLNRPLRHCAFAPKSRGIYCAAASRFSAPAAWVGCPFMFDMLAGAQQLAAGGVARE